VPRKPKEISIEQHFVDEMKKAFPTAQVHKYEIRRSEPDRICLLPGGRCVFVELKRPGEDLREEQVRAAKRLHALGFECYKVSSKNEVDGLIEFMKTEAFVPMITGE